MSYFTQALDFHWADFCDSGWGKIYLGEPTGNWNQRWEINGKELICKGSNEEPIDDLRMDVFENGTEDGTKVGVYRQNGQSNQHWNLLGETIDIISFNNYAFPMFHRKSVKLRPN